MGAIALPRQIELAAGGNLPHRAAATPVASLKAVEPARNACRLHLVYVVRLWLDSTSGSTAAAEPAGGGGEQCQTASRFRHGGDGGEPATRAAGEDRRTLELDRVVDR